MRYNCIREMDISNGIGIGISLFTQGCNFHCKNCFNPETWDFNGGKEWNNKVEDKFLKLILRPFISRFSILGGEPLEQTDDLISIISKVRKIKPDIKVWLWSGYTYEKIVQDKAKSKILDYIDYLIDGKFIYEQKDFNLKFRGSSNQKIYEKSKQDIWVLSKDFN